MKTTKPVFVKITWIFLFFGALAASSCTDPPASVYPEAVPGNTATKLSSGDKIQVRIEYGTRTEEIINREYVLDESGEIAIPYIDVVVAKGKTIAELRTEVKERLADGYLKNPIVWINLESSSSIQFSVMGEVKSPNLYTFRNGMSHLRRDIAGWRIYWHGEKKCGDSYPTAKWRRNQKIHSACWEDPRQPRL